MKISVNAWGRSRLLSSKRGISLLEVLVAGFMASIVILSAVAVIPKIQQGFISAQQAKDAGSLASGTLSNLRANIRQTALTSSTDLVGGACQDPNAYDRSTVTSLTIHGMQYTIKKCLVQGNMVSGQFVPTGPDQQTTALVDAVTQVEYSANGRTKVIRMESLLNRDSASAVPTGQVTITVDRADASNPDIASTTNLNSVIGTSVTIYLPGNVPYVQGIPAAAPNNKVTFNIPEGQYLLQVNQNGFYPYRFFAVNVDHNTPFVKTVLIRAQEEYSSKAVGEAFVSTATPVVSMIVRDTERAWQCACQAPICSGCINIPNELVVLANPTQSAIAFNQIKVYYYDDDSVSPRAIVNGVDGKIYPRGAASASLVCHNPVDNSVVACSSKMIPAGGYFLIEGIPASGSNAPWDRSTNPNPVYPDVSYDVSQYDLLLASATIPSAVEVYSDTVNRPGVAFALSDVVGIESASGVPPVRKGSAGNPIPGDWGTPETCTY